MSLVGVDDGFCLACNRDERHTRAPAAPPAVRRVGDRHALFPIDPVGPGTWIGVNDAGLTAVVLNRAPAVANPAGRRSRGLIVPALLQCGTIGHVRQWATTFEVAAFAPFRILVARRRALLLGDSDGRRLTIRQQALDEPLVLASSSLGDHLVEGPRAALFDRLVRRHAIPATAQRAFHAHRWPWRPEVSVVMARADARTVSRTFVDVTPGGARMIYERLSLVRPRVFEATLGQSDAA